MSEEFYRARKVRRVLRIREYDINTNKLLSKANYPISEYADYDFIVRQGKIRTMFRKNKNNFFTFDLVTFEEDIKSEKEFKEELTPRNYKMREYLENNKIEFKINRE